MRGHYDHIVIGAGSAGCVLADRLTAAGRSVLLIEAGGSDRALDVQTPAAFSKLFHTDRDWDLATEPEPGAKHRRLYVPRGRMLGGSSSMNAMIYVRGRAEDYDRWRDQYGLEGWGWDDGPAAVPRGRGQQPRGLRAPRRRRTPARRGPGVRQPPHTPVRRRLRAGRVRPQRRRQRPDPGRRHRRPGDPAQRSSVVRGGRLPPPRGGPPRAARRAGRPGDAPAGRGRPCRRGRGMAPRRDPHRPGRGRGDPVRRGDRLAAPAAAVGHRTGRPPA